MEPIVVVLVAVGVLLVGVAIGMNRKQSASGGRALQPTREAASAASGQEPAAVASKERVNWLVGVGGEVEGRAFLIGHRTVTIGRAPTNFIQVVDDEASRTHTQLTPREGALQVVDMNSRNGTYINGTPTTQGRMHEGDELRIGAARFVFQIRGSFDSDASVQRKEADARKFVSTVAAEGSNLQVLIENTLRKHKGDFEEAGKELGIDPNVLRHIVAQRDIRW